jgi:hypothetical protein
MLSPAAKTERVETRGATERRATTASAAALGAATGDTRTSHGDGRNVVADCANQRARQQRRGATFAARTVTFLFARDRKRRDTPRALARISTCGGDETRGAGRRAAKAISFFCGSPGRGRDVCPERKCSRDTNTRCKRRDRAWEGEANVNERTNRTTRAGVKPRRCFCGWAAPVCSTRPAKTVTRRGGARYRV